MTYRLTRRAAQDVRTIYRASFKLFGELQADRYHQNLERTMELLAGNPSLTRLRDEIRPPVRVHPVESHLIIYREIAANSIEIIRVCHGHEDWQRKRL